MQGKRWTSARCREVCFHSASVISFRLQTITTHARYTPYTPLHTPLHTLRHECSPLLDEHCHQRHTHTRTHTNTCILLVSVSHRHSSQSYELEARASGRRVLLTKPLCYLHLSANFTSLLTKPLVSDRSRCMHLVTHLAHLPHLSTSSIYGSALSCIIGMPM